ncbi:MAG: ATP-binding cassette domain-containing protein [Terriglobales bacterium]
MSTAPIPSAAAAPSLRAERQRPPGAAGGELRSGTAAPYGVECRNLSRFFGIAPALRRVALQLPAGHLLMLLGANGAGKSTLLRILAGALRPSSGQVWISGAAWGTPEARRWTGFLAHDSLLHPRLTVEENLRYYARLYGAVPAAAAASLRRVGGERLANMRVDALSQGMRQKAALARCLLHAPRVLLLDEPLASLDRATVADLRRLLVELRDAGLTLIASTHTPETLADLADAQLVLERGRVAPEAP